MVACEYPIDRLPLRSARDGFELPTARTRRDRLAKSASEITQWGTCWEKGFCSLDWPGPFLGTPERAHEACRVGPRRPLLRSGGRSLHAITASAYLAHRTINEELPSSRRRR